MIKQHDGEIPGHLTSDIFHSADGKLAIIVSIHVQNFFDFAPFFPPVLNDSGQYTEGSERLQM